MRYGQPAFTDGLNITERAKEQLRTMAPERVREICEIIMALPSTGMMRYAQTYAKALLDGKVHERDYKVQMLYVFNNCQGWRGDQAKAIKKEVNDWFKKPERRIP